MSEEKIEYEEPSVEVEVNEEENKIEETPSEENVEKSNSADSNTNDSDSKEGKANIPDKLDKITDSKIKGRIIILDAENSEFAKNLDLKKPGDYVEKK